MTAANQLLESLSTLRRQWRTRVILESAVWILGAALMAIVVGGLISVAFGETSAAMTVARVLAYALVAVAVVRYLVIPLARRMSEERFALYVEERAPELKQALLSAVHEIRSPNNLRGSPSLAARMIERTLLIVRPLTVGAMLERPRMLRASRALGAVFVAAALLFAGPKNVRHMARTLFAPWSVAEAATPAMSVSVKPGNVTIPRGAAVDIRAALVNFNTEGAELVVRNDSSGDWARVPMARDSMAGGFTSRVFDLTRVTEYYVDANGIKSPMFRIGVSDLPAMRSLALDLHFPSYTGLPNQHVDAGGDVAAVIGTLVTVHATITRPVKAGAIVFNDGTSVPFSIQADGRLAATFRVTKTGYYRVDLVAPDGATVPGSVEFAVEALEDHAPTVAIESPGRDTKVTSIDEQTIAVKASDDYGVESMELRYRVNGGAEQKAPMVDSSSRHATEARAAHTIFLEELGLKPGDLVTYYAVAKDGANHTGTSDVYFLEVRPFNKNYRAAEQGGGGGGGGGGETDDPDGLVARQRDIVAGTFNWLRDSSHVTDRKRQQDIATINIAEGRLREDVKQLTDRIAQRAAARVDTLFNFIRAELDTAATQLHASEEKLVKGRGSDAIPAEQQALQHLQRAQSYYRDIQVQRGQQQQGGGGKSSGNKKAEDLADLFELETDKMKNQYEQMPQSQQQQQQQGKEVDAVMEKLKELAARQQSENERAEKLAAEMQKKMPQQQGSGGGGGGGSQRELAKQAEEEARKLERLAREQGNKELADAAQKLQQAADAMKKASAGQQGQGKNALDQLSRAANGLDNARTQASSDAVKKLAQDAKDLESRQQDIANDVKKLADLPYDQRTAQVQQLGARKDQLSKDVGKLETDADRLARDARRDQPAASKKLGDGAEAIRDQRLRSMITDSKRVLRSGSPDMTNSYEGLIGQNLADVSEKMRDAANSISAQSSSKSQEKALDRTRELVKGLESLRDRTNEHTGVTQPNGPAGPQGSQQGANGKQLPQGSQGSQQGKAQQGKGQQGKGQQGKGNQAQGQQGQQGQGGGGNQSGQRGTSGGGNRGGQPDGAANGQLTGLNPEAARQLAKEFTLRREAAQQIRNELARKGMDVSELDKAIESLDKLEKGQGFGDPKTLEQLQANAIEQLKSFEFGLYRKLGLNGDNSPSLGGRAPVPEEYRASVEEYYRSLAAGAKPKP